MKPIWDFFKDTYANLSAFKADWDRLPESDRADLRKGIENGSLTY